VAQGAWQNTNDLVVASTPRTTRFIYEDSRLPSGSNSKNAIDKSNRNKGVSTMIKVGDLAPAFSIPNQDGANVSLSDHSGKYVLIWWYPKADTPG
tara:strand:- start:637 stop:921 length:285 start_codon:yes stop_codon:yes gene_type:complete